ncbi:NUDIX hydrolase [Vogesella sp. LIG4]|uniref:NUDIX hydrolase n=1 Tax=Vogesella sp. LIG4 TaxID=1192162 RepID=UPI0008202100|nr:NUDIX hydrolase [Vogesella sp. LIG4]SCK20025.1 ADP-ribose pyrophosphatase YjhB, NUDIX family [Vogesella sp. LIG4]
MQWKPNTTVAALIERDGRFLMVREQTPQGVRLNQPAGHLEYAETLPAAVAREALEETGYRATATALVGIYLADKEDGSDVTYLRFAFACDAEAQPSSATLDEGIIEALWLSADEIRAQQAIWRSPLVGRCIDDYLAGQRLPLTVIHHQAR